MTFDDPLFWLAALQIIWINILLSGDNAVVIALACRMLPPVQRRWGMALGAGAAVLLRILFTALLTRFLSIPFVKLGGGLALLWIAFSLLNPGGESEAHDSADAPATLWRAVWMVVVADIVMSLDNVIAIAAAAKGSIVLIVFGLAISVPLVIAGSAAIMALLDRYSWLVWAGAALLGWVAGGIIAEDTGLRSWLGFAHGQTFEFSLAAAGVAIVLAAGWLVQRQRTAADHP